jgi:cytochrome c
MYFTEYNRLKSQVSEFFNGKSNMVRAEPDVTLPDGNVAKGAKLFKSKCAQCHTDNKGGATKQGPNLYGVIGREAGQVEGYPFTEGT